MIIESIPHGAIPYRCKECESLYLWKPGVKKEYCGIKTDKPECINHECAYFEIEAENPRCPICYSKHREVRISNFRYKLMRALYYWRKEA